MKTIAWDVDDVLNDQTHIWFKSYWRPAHPDCSLVYTQLSENPPHRLLGISQSEYLASLDRFRLAKAAYLNPVPEVLQWFQQYGMQSRHLALSAVPLSAADISAEWVIKYFGRWIRTFSFVPSTRDGETLPVYDIKKAEFLHWWGKADVLIDDSSAHVESARRLGLHAVLMPRPWNNSSLTIAETLETLTHIAS